MGDQNMFYFVLSILCTVTAAESDQLRNIVTATIATLGLESFNADTNSNYELVTMVPVDCATSDLDEPNCIVSGMIRNDMESLTCAFTLFTEGDDAYIGTECFAPEEEHGIAKRRWSRRKGMFYHPI